MKQKGFGYPSFKATARGEDGSFKDEIVSGITVVTQWVHDIMAQNWNEKIIISIEPKWGNGQ